MSVSLTSSPIDGTPADRVRPKYEQLWSRLVADVAQGRLKPGDALPSEPVMAEQLNLARSTVRQALSKLERTGLVRRIPGKGTYVHEDAQRRLRGGLDAFAIIVPDTQAGYYPSLMAGFEEASSAVRNQVIVISTRNDPYRQGDAVLQLIDKQVAGVAMVPVSTPATPAYQIRQLQRNGIPVVLCHRGIEEIRAPLLALNGRDVGRLAGEEIVRRKHQRVAFISALKTDLSEKYEVGLRQALESSGRELPPENALYLGSDGYAEPERYERLMDQAIGSLMDREPTQRPTAIFTGFDQTAELIYLQLMRRNISVPDDVSLVSFGGVNRLSPMQHRLSAVTVDESEIGGLAARLLDEMRNGSRAIESDERFDIALSFHEGQTLGRLPQST